MQLLIDTDTAPTSELQAIIVMLSGLAAERSTPRAAEEMAADVAPIAPAAPPAPPAPAPVLEVSPAAAFGGNVHQPDHPARERVEAVVPPPPVAVAAVPVAAVDATGLPWDARVHSESKAKNKDGSWRTRRNLVPGLLEAVTAELRGSVATLTVPAQPATAADVAAVAVPPPPPPVSLPAPGAVVVPPPPSVSLPGVPPPPPPAAAVLPGNGTQPLDFPTLMKKITQATMTGKLRQDEIPPMLKLLGVDSLTALAAKPDCWAAVSAAVTAKTG